MVEENRMKKTVTQLKQGTHITQRAQRVLRSLYDHKLTVEGLIARYERGERGKVESQLTDEVEQMEEAFQIGGSR